MRSHAVLVFDDDQSVIIDISCPSLKGKLGEVDGATARCKDARWQRTGDPIHEIKIMTALLNQSPARVRRKFIPFIDLTQKGRSVLADAEHFHVADIAVGNGFERQLVLRLIAVLHAQQNWRWVSQAFVCQVNRIVQGRRHRLFKKDSFAGCLNSVEYPPVCEVGRANQNGIDPGI